VQWWGGDYPRGSARNSKRRQEDWEQKNLRGAKGKARLCDAQAGFASVETDYCRFDLAHIFNRHLSRTTDCHCGGLDMLLTYSTTQTLEPSEINLAVCPAGMLKELVGAMVSPEAGDTVVG
jgi:hypothetical protein